MKKEREMGKRENGGGASDAEGNYSARESGDNLCSSGPLITGAKLALYQARVSVSIQACIIESTYLR